MKPAELVAKIAEAVQAVTANNSLVFSDAPMTADQLDEAELRIGQIFEVEAKRLETV